MKRRSRLMILAVSCSLAVGLVAGSPLAGRNGHSRLEAAPAPILAQPVSVAVDQVHGWAVVATSLQDAQTGGAAGPGRVALLALRGGAVRVAGSLTVGASPVAVYVDPQGQHALILNVGGGDKNHGFTGSSINLLDQSGDSSPPACDLGRAPQDSAYIAVGLMGKGE